MLLELARSRRILFFGGKGGVGKTTVSAATALAMADQNRKILLVSTDPAHNLGHLFDRTIGSSPVRLAAGLDGMELDPAQTVSVHLEEVSAALRRVMPKHLLGEVDKHMELSRDAPGMQEAAMLERIAEVVEQGLQSYDLVVFDTAPSGHTARLMALPEMMSAWTEGLIKRRDKADSFTAVLRGMAHDRSSVDKGERSRLFGDSLSHGESTGDRENRIRQLLNRRRQRFAGLRDVISDPACTAFIIVLAAERLPVLETIELHEQLQRAGISVGGLVVNKRVPVSSDPFLAERRTQEEIHMKTLQDKLPALPRQDLALCSHDVLGLSQLQEFSRLLATAGESS